MRYELINPDALGAPKGWTNGMLARPGDRILFVAGQDAAGPDGEVESDDFVAQFDAALRKTVLVVREAGGGPEDIGRITLFVTDLDAYLSKRHEVGEAYRSLMGKHYPAMSLVQVKGLVHPRAQIEIEATAVLGEPAP